MLASFLRFPVKTGLFAFAVLLFMASAVWSAPGAKANGKEDDVSIFKAFDLENNKPVYVGFQTLSVEDTTLVQKVSYTREDGTLIHARDQLFNKDTLAVVSLKGEDQRTGRVEEIQVQGDTITLKFKKNKTSKLETTTLKAKSNQYIGATMPFLIQQKWEELQAGKEVTFDLIVVSRLEELGFRLIKDRDDQVKGQSVSVIRLEPTSWVIKKIAPKMSFFMANAADHKPLQYEGRSVVTDDKGDDLMVRVVYDAEPKK